MALGTNRKQPIVGAKRWSLHPRAVVLYNLIYRTLKGSYSGEL